MSDSRVDEYAAGLTSWRDEFAALRTILRATELAEAFKWHKPCYTHSGKNIAIFQPFNDVCALMFFKGALLNDPQALLREQGKHSRSSRRLEFRSVADVTSRGSAVRRLVADAIRVEQSGLRVTEPAPLTHRDYPAELVALMEADPAFRDAFQRLTPGRQRGYLLHFNGAKQSATRAARIERVQDRIREGFGLHD
ncbi:MAG TPA: YdeI/OmpD-associated family protein [Solirubrobacteraceae bacterium]|nr:YdeI/OmpD-associated family protein [Solirubrobacteraceae bacterium]